MSAELQAGFAFAGGALGGGGGRSEPSEVERSDGGGGTFWGTSTALNADPPPRGRTGLDRKGLRYAGTGKRSPNRDPGLGTNGRSLTKTTEREP